MNAMEYDKALSKLGDRFRINLEVAMECGREDIGNLKLGLEGGPPPEAGRGELLAQLIEKQVEPLLKDIAFLAELARKLD